MAFRGNWIKLLIVSHSVDSYRFESVMILWTKYLSVSIRVWYSILPRGKEERNWNV